MPPGKRSRPHRILFITGTDTGVGKTVLTVLLARNLEASGFRVSVFKPISSGRRDDARALRSALARRPPLDAINPWHFSSGVAPLLAARRARRFIPRTAVLAHIRRHAKCADVVLVEGAGGLLSPLGEDLDSRTLLRTLRAVPIVVCPNRLGAINQARLALEALPKANRPKAVLVLVDPGSRDASSSSNARLLADYLDSRRIIVLPWIQRWTRRGACNRPDLRQALARLVSATLPMP